MNAFRKNRLKVSVSCAAMLLAWQAGANDGAGTQGLSAAQERIEAVGEDVIAPLNQTLEQSNAHEQLDGNAQADTLQENQPRKGRDLDSGIASKLPSFENLAKLKAKMRAEPKNLDHYFAHAQMAGQLGEYAIAAQTYEAMLQLAPGLDRIRLDLGSAYMRIGQFEKAREQLKKVAAMNHLPPNVRSNVESVLARIDDELREHDFSGLISAGINWDTNANSAPRGEYVSLLIGGIDQAAALSDEQLAQRDIQGYVATGITHTYRPRSWQDDRFSRRWKTSLNRYQSKQSTQEAIDITVHSVRTGPEFESKSSGIRVNPALNYNVITLDGHTYLRNTALEANTSIPIDPQWLITADVKTEWRDFVNSPNVSTYEEREGIATQQSVSARYIATETDILSLTFTHRREHTTEEHFDNTQMGGSLSYTRVLPYDIFAVATTGYKHTLYEENDPLISTRRRRDGELTAGLTLGHQIAEGLTITGGYQYRSVQSNVRNYDYDNHRLSASITRQF